MKNLTKTELEALIVDYEKRLDKVVALETVAFIHKRLAQFKDLLAKLDQDSK